MEQLRRDDPRTLGPYRLLGTIGAGGMGRVLLGVDEHGTRVACKIVHAEIAADPGFRERFRREVGMVSAAPAWFTAPVLAADPDADRPWLATEYVEGPSLRERVDRGVLAGDELTGLAGRLATGLAALHAAGVAHRDIKPANVLLDGDAPRLIDFGIARAPDLTSITVSGHILGTPSFMSPEQAAGARDVGPSSDVFSLGALIAFLATGRSPFAAETAAGSLYRVTYDEPELEGLSGPVRAVVQACLAKDPAARPTADQLRATFVDGVALPARPATLPSPRPPGTDRGAGVPVAASRGPVTGARAGADTRPARPPAGVVGPPVAAATGTRPVAVPGPRPVPDRIGAATGGPARTSPAAGAPGSGSTGGPAGAAGGQRPPRGSGRRIVVPALLAALGAAVLVVLLSTLLRPGGADPAADGAGSVADGPPIDTTADPRFGTDVLRFRSPSANIVCRVSATETRCDVANREWQVPAAPAACTARWATGTVLGPTGEAELSCVDDSLDTPEPAVLEYGDGVRLGDVTCVSRESGVRCENASTLHGFGVSRAAFELF